jgi:hypothetical protein
MSKRSKKVKKFWRENAVNLTMPMREWARTVAKFSPLVAAWLEGKCKACHRQATA